MAGDDEICARTLVDRDDKPRAYLLETMVQRQKNPIAKFGLLEGLFGEKVHLTGIAKSKPRRGLGVEMDDATTAESRLVQTSRLPSPKDGANRGAVHGDATETPR